MKLRTLVPIFLLLSAVWPGTCSGEQVSVAQLTQILANPDPLPAGFKNGGAPVALLQDSMMAHRLDTLELTQRLTHATLASLLEAHAFGPQSVRALTVLSYRSELLDPPPDELPNRPAPDAAEQQRMLLAASAYVFKTLTHLPDFFATRTTKEFYGVPPELNETGLPVQMGLYPHGSSSH